MQYFADSQMTHIGLTWWVRRLSLGTSGYRRLQECSKEHPPSRSCGGLGALRALLRAFGALSLLPPKKSKKIQDGRHGPKMAASNRYGSN